MGTGGWEQCSSNSLVICGLPVLLSKIFIQSICSCQFNTLWIHRIILFIYKRYDYENWQNHSFINKNTFIVLTYLILELSKGKEELTS